MLMYLHILSKFESWTRLRREEKYKSSDFMLIPQDMSCTPSVNGSISLVGCRDNVSLQSGDYSHSEDGCVDCNVHARGVGYCC